MATLQVGPRMAPNRSTAKVLMGTHQISTVLSVLALILGGSLLWDLHNNYINQPTNCFSHLPEHDVSAVRDVAVAATLLSIGAFVAHSVVWCCFIGATIWILEAILLVLEICLASAMVYGAHLARQSTIPGAPICYTSADSSYSVRADAPFYLGICALCLLVLAAVVHAVVGIGAFRSNDPGRYFHFMSTLGGMRESDESAGGREYKRVLRVVEF